MSLMVAVVVVSGLLAPDVGAQRRQVSSPIVAAPVLAEPHSRALQLVGPGESIQAAIDRAAEGGWVFVRPGTYQETADATNGLNITRSIHLVGLSSRSRRVVLRNSGGQRNGIVAVPAAHTDCMGCHSSLAPPFDLLPGVDTNASDEPTIHGLTISGISIQGFINNGLFTRNVRGFAIVNVESVGNKNYGIFPTLSSNGLITLSTATGSDDSGIWVETSENVAVVDNSVEGNVIGIEISNSDDILLEHNEAQGNSIGIAIMFLPDAFAGRPDLRRITVRNNYIHDNNKVNTAPPGSTLSLVPSSLGIFHLGADDSLIAWNLIENHDFAGIGIVDYCLGVSGGPFDCSIDPRVSPAFLLDQSASNNRVIGNVLRNNGTNPDPTNPFGFAASDLGLLTLDDNGNCFRRNSFSTFFSLLGVLPDCQ
jgi:parallel beta-helix repeat protein